VINRIKKLCEELNDSIPNIDVLELFNKIQVYPNNADLSKLGATLSRDELLYLEQLLKKVDVDRAAQNRSSGKLLLFHGTPHKIDKFMLTRGQRSGFMGSTHEVDNLGIFLTDSRRLAHYFGDNRGNFKGYTVYPVWANVGRVLDFSKWTSVPLSARKIAKELLEEYDGYQHSINSTPRDLQWWLLDQPEFIEELIKYFDTIKYKEEPSILREAGDTKAFTYFVFDPSRLEIAKSMAIKATPEDLNANIDYLKSLAGLEEDYD